MRFARVKAVYASCFLVLVCALVFAQEPGGGQVVNIAFNEALYQEVRLAFDNAIVSKGLGDGALAGLRVVKLSPETADRLLSRVALGVSVAATDREAARQRLIKEKQQQK